jgi:hypothetical protein
VNPLLPDHVPFFSRRSMAVAAIGTDLYFFGGVGAAGTDSILDVSDDLWCFDTCQLTWKQVRRDGAWPSSRRCIGFVGLDGKLLLWGGSGVIQEEDAPLRHTFLNDEWRFDPMAQQWDLLMESEDHRKTPLRKDRPFPRYTPVLQPVGRQFFLFGGYTEDRLGKRKLNDTWVQSAGQWHQIPVTTSPGYLVGADGPGLRYGCMSATDGENVYICGGFSDDGDHNDVWRFSSSMSCWELLAPEVSETAIPAPRYCAAFSYFDDQLFMFGGRSRRYPKLNFNDLWVFDLTKNKWSVLTDNRLPHQYDAESVYPAYHAKSSSVVCEGFWYLWGGEGFRGHVSDFWRYSFQSGEWQLIQSARNDDPIFW